MNNKVLKAFLLCLVIGISIYSVFFLLANDPDAKIFFAQSLLDSGMFCAMFIAVLIATGMSC